MNDKTGKTVKTGEAEAPKFDMDKLNRIYQEETGQVKEEVESEGRRAQASLGLSSAPRELDLDGIADTFCEAWPKAMKFFNFAFMFAGWFPGMGTMVIMAKGVIAAIDKSLVPTLCGIQPAATRQQGSTSSTAGGSTGQNTSGPRNRDPGHR